MKKLSVYLLSILCVEGLLAGSAQVALECKSDSGLTTVNARVPGDEEEYRVEVSIKDKNGDLHTVSYIKEYQYKGPDSIPELLLDGVVRVVDGIQYKDRVYTLTMLKERENAMDISNTLYAIPESVVFKQIGGHERKVNFRAKLSGFNPRLGDENSDNPFIDGFITLNCSYSYSI